LNVTAATLPLSANRATAGTYAGLFMVTLTTLMYEIALTRIFSVTMFYHFAFVALSVALFGMTVGALIVYLQPERFADADLPRLLWRYALLFSASIAICFITQLTIPFSPKWNIVSVWSVVLTCAIISVPFIFSGIVVCLALTRFPDRVNRLYAADLIGAALGCVMLVIVFSRLDGPSAIIAIAAIGAIGALCFALSLSGTRPMWLALAAFGALGGLALLNGYLAEQRDPILRIMWAKEAPEPKHQYEKWNAFSRVTVNGDPTAPQTPIGWGMSAKLPESMKVNQLLMTIDGFAGTVLTRYDGDPASTDFLRYDVTNLAHYIRNDADVLVIGVGGGRDVLSALEFDQKHVTGVEINDNVLGTTNGAFGDFTGHLDRNPRVKMVNDEARSYVTRTDADYDIIQISLIDTWAATAAGAYALSENSLYTTEAWNTFFDHLQPGGILSVSRWYAVQGQEPLETYRTVALAAEVLKQRGAANPRDHILVYAGPYGAGSSSATVLVSPEPFTAADRATITAETRRLEFNPVITGDVTADADFEALVSTDGPGAAVASFDEDISPPTDNRPFFFQMARLRGLFDGTAYGNNIVERPALVLGVLALAVLGLAAAAIGVPLAVTARRVSHQGMLPFYTYFAGIGLAFLLVEISQLQRLNIFLGHPTYSLTVVLFSLLLSSGIGSMISEKIISADRPVSMIAPLAVLMAAVIGFGIATPGVIDSFSDESTPFRIGVAIALLMPLGLVMGMPFPVGMRAASLRANAPTAFFWGINGAMSVCASVLGMVIAIFFGIAAAFWTGAVCYAIAAASITAIVWLPTREASAPPEALEPETAAT
jgi:predicted membrane-bound spermidine synthase